MVFLLLLLFCNSGNQFSQSIEHMHTHWLAERHSLRQIVVVCYCASPFFSTRRQFVTAGWKTVSFNCTSVSHRESYNHYHHHCHYTKCVSSGAGRRKLKVKQRKRKKVNELSKRERSAVCAGRKYCKQLPHRWHLSTF